MNNIKVVNNLDFGKISKAIGLIIEPADSISLDTILKNTGQVAYDTQVKRLKVMNTDLISRGLLHTGDVISSITGPSGYIPDATAVLNLVISNSINKTVGSFDINTPIAEYPKGLASSAVGAIQINDGSAPGPSIRRGDLWYVKNQLIRGVGPGGLVQVKSGDILISLIDNATNNHSDWLVIENDLNYATTTDAGLIRLATDLEVLSGATGVAVSPTNLEYWKTEKKISSKFITFIDMLAFEPYEIFYSDITGPSIFSTKINGESILLYNITSTNNSITLLSALDLDNVEITIIG